MFLVLFRCFGGVFGCIWVLLVVYGFFGGLVVFLVICSCFSVLFGVFGCFWLFFLLFLVVFGCFWLF